MELTKIIKPLDMSNVELIHPTVRSSVYCEPDDLINIKENDMICFGYRGYGERLVIGFAKEQNGEMFSVITIAKVAPKTNDSHWANPGAELNDFLARQVTRMMRREPKEENGEGLKKPEDMTDEQVQKLKSMQKEFLCEIANIT